MKTIEITVGPKGETTVQTKGFKGNECRDASRFVEVALGHRTAELLTPEFHQGNQASQDLRQSNRHLRGRGRRSSWRSSPSNHN